MIKLHLPSRASLWCAVALSATVLGFGTATVWAEPEKTQTLVHGANGALLPRDSKDAAVFRGGLVYANYCVTCHGINADGNGRASQPSAKGLHREHGACATCRAQGITARR